MSLIDNRLFHFTLTIKHAKFSTIGIKKREGSSSRINLESKTPKPHVILDYLIN